MHHRGKPGAEFLPPAPSAGLRNPCPAPGLQPCSGGRPPIPAPEVHGRQDNAAEGVQDLHAAHRGRGKCRAGSGLTRSRLLRPQPRGAAYPAAASQRASHYGRQGNWWNITSKTRRLGGKEEGELLFALVTPAGEGGVGWGGGFQVGPFGAPRIHDIGDQNAPNGVGAPPLSN